MGILDNTFENPIVGPLDEDWSKKLIKLLTKIEQKKDVLTGLSQRLARYMDTWDQQSQKENKKLHFIYLTRQGIPVYWIIKGIYDASNRTMPEHSVLGIKSNTLGTTTSFDSADTEKFRQVLKIGNDGYKNIFIDDTLSTGNTFRSCYDLVQALGGNRSCYDDFVFSPNINVPWDMSPNDTEELYDPEDIRFKDFHPYLSPKIKGTASIPILNNNYNSQIGISQIAEQLYLIGQSVGTAKAINTTPKKWD